MRKYYSFLFIFMIFSMFESKYANAQIVVIKDNNINSEYRKIPEGFKCNVPNKANALCINSEGVKFFANIQLYSGQGYLDTNKFLNYFEGVLNNNQASIIKSYTTPEIIQHIAQEDNKYLHRQGQRVNALTIETELRDNRLGVGSIVFKFLPNNGAPITEVTSYSVTFPRSLKNKFNQFKNDYYRFMMSSRYDDQYVQAVNVRHSQFLANLGARQRAFNVSQNQIHRNNIKALDDSYNSFQQRSAVSDQSHNAFINSTHERQQMTDSTTGQTYDVYGNYDHNYVNPNNINQQIQTNDHMYNPNINNNIGEYYNELE